MHRIAPLVVLAALVVGCASSQPAPPAPALDCGSAARSELEAWTAAGATDTLAFAQLMETETAAGHSTETAVNAALDKVGAAYGRIRDAYITPWPAQRALAVSCGWTTAEQAAGMDMLLDQMVEACIISEWVPDIVDRCR